MKSITLEFSDELVRLAGFKPEQLSKEALNMIVLELYREEALSLGKAAELTGMSVAEFMEFTASRRVPLHYGEQDLEHDREYFRKRSYKSG